MRPFHIVLLSSWAAVLIAITPPGPPDDPAVKFLTSVVNTRQWKGADPAVLATLPFPGIENAYSGPATEKDRRTVCEHCMWWLLVLVQRGGSDRAGALSRAYKDIGNSKMADKFTPCARDTASLLYHQWTFPQAAFSGKSLAFLSSTDVHAVPGKILPARAFKYHPGKRLKASLTCTDALPRNGLTSTAGRAVGLSTRSAGAQIA